MFATVFLAWFFAQKWSDLPEISEFPYRDGKGALVWGVEGVVHFEGKVSYVVAVN